MKNGVKIGIGIAGFLGALIVGYFALIIYINWPGGVTVAKGLLVAGEWTDVAIDPAVTAAKQVQSINLRIDDFRADRDANGSDIKLPDGTVVEPEIELYDEFANKVDFRHSGFVRKTYDDVVFSPDSELPKDRRFTKLRIRSNVPFSCGEIYWMDHNLK